MFSAFLNLNKSKGMTSAKAVAKLKHILLQKGYKINKIGHFGTLDPDGEGVLPIAIGRATRLFDIAPDKEKIYYTEFVFGKTTDTLDEGGTVTETCGKSATEEEISAAIPSLTGKIRQLPPLYSAKSVDGRRAYELARAGEKFELKEKEVEIYSIDFLGKAGDAFAFRVRCSAGTYIRSLARDMAAEVGTLGYMRYIRREKSGFFRLETAKTLEEFSSLKNLDGEFVDMDDVLSGLPEYSLNDNREGARLILNGVPLKLAGLPDGLFRFKIDGKLQGVAEKDADGAFKWAVRLI